MSQHWPTLAHAMHVVQSIQVAADMKHPCFEGFFFFSTYCVSFLLLLFINLTTLLFFSLLINHYDLPYINVVVLSKDTLKQLVFYEQSASLQVSQETHQLLQSLENETLIPGSSCKSLRV